MSQILQKQITLDEALLGGMRTFRNGCNFRIYSRNGGEWYELGFGCDGVYVNLIQGHERLLYNWLIAGENLDKERGPIRRLDSASPETIIELLKRSPCEVCGGFLFEARK